MLSEKDTEAARQKSLARFFTTIVSTPAWRSMSPEAKRAFIKRGRNGVARNNPRGLFKTLRAVLTKLPLETVLEIFGFLDPKEQLALQDVLFGRIVTWQRDVRRSRVTPEQIEQMQRLLEKHVAAAKAART